MRNIAILAIAVSIGGACASSYDHNVTAGLWAIGAAIWASHSI